MKKFVLLVLLIGVLYALTGCSNEPKNETNETDNFKEIDVKEIEIKEVEMEETKVNSELEGIEKRSNEYIEAMYWNSVVTNDNYGTLKVEMNELKDQGYTDVECYWILAGRYGAR